MHAQIHFFPLGNADTLRLDLADGRKILVDYANMRCADDLNDLRCDLPRELWRDLVKARRNYFDAVCITHLDDDHCRGFGDFFWLRHALKYQGDDRVHIRQLWVPAAAIIEEKDDLTDDARLVQAEARHRLKEGNGVLVFSRPEALKAWMQANRIDFESRKHLIVNAGQLVPGYTKEGSAQAEFFVHSPFGWRQDESTVIDRNQNSIFLQVTFRESGNEIYALLGSDLDYESIAAVVQVTRKHGNAHRLRWDVMKLFHHCSYLSLAPERGTDETEAAPEVKWLFESQGRDGAIIVSPSKPIPVKGSNEDFDDQPPHRQAANYHRRVAHQLSGQFIVTMEYPSINRPRPLGYEITAYGLAPIITAPTIATTAAAETPRAG